MTDTPDYVTILARETSGYLDEEWIKMSEYSRFLYRDRATQGIAKLAEAGFVIMPRRPNEEILRILYERPNWDIGPSRFYEKILEAGQK